MRKLNLKKVRWIVKTMKNKELSVYKIAKQQEVSSRWCRALYRRFSNSNPRDIKFKKLGRKSDVIFDGNVIMQLLHEHPGVGARSLEKLLQEKGIEISHNKVHKILRTFGIAKKEPAKSKRRKWVRYERDRSNSLWHTDYCEINGKQFIAFEDDSSRYIVAYGVFDNATTDNALKTFMKGVKEYEAPVQVMSDHGPQFCKDEDNNYRFRNGVNKVGTELILSRVKHPQSNGKIERFFSTVRKLLPYFDNDFDKVVEYYNFRRPHMSLEAEGKLVRPYEAYVLRGGKINERLLYDQ